MRLAGIIASGVISLAWLGAQMNVKQVSYKVLTPITQGNLTVFPVAADKLFDTSEFLTLDEGIRSGKVTVAEMGTTTGLVRPRPARDGVWREGVFPPRAPEGGARVNSLALLNNSDRPLILLAGEIVTGGKQDRVVGKDRIVPAHSEPVSLDVFCVEPHRWTGNTGEFGAMAGTMAQPSVRAKAMGARNQQQVWDEVASSREAFAAALPAPQAAAIRSSSSYAGAMQNSGVRSRVDSIAAPIQRDYEKLIGKLQSEKAVGAVVAVNGELIWVDVFASPALLEKYWPKLVRSYAAESLAPRVAPTSYGQMPTLEMAQSFLDHLYSKHENIETEPGVYRNTEIEGEDFDAFLLTSLLPNGGFQVHIAKMKR